MQFDLIIIGLYLLIQIGIGVWAGKTVKTETDFLLGGRSLGMFLATFTIFATWFGAEASIGSAGSVYMDGLTGARVEPFGYTFALLLCALLLAKKLRERAYMTLADFFADRFGYRIEKAAVFILVPSTLTWTAAQILAFGHLLTAVLGLPVNICLAIAVAVVVFYSSFGGFMGSVYTDLLQALVLIVGMLALLFFSLPYLHENSLQTLLSNSAASMIHNDGGKSVLFRLDSWAIPILGSLTSQELISRLLAAKSPQIAKWASIFAAILYFAVGLIPVFLGLAGQNFPIQITQPDEYLPQLAKIVLPGFLYVLFSAAMISAILSTADSSLITITGLVTHNLLHKWVENLSETKKVWLGRIVLILCGLAVLQLAMRADKIYDLLLLASSLGTAGILILTLMGLWSSIGNELSAFACLSTGLICPVLFSWWDIEAPFLLTIFICLITYITLALLTKKLPSKLLTLKN